MNKVILMLIFIGLLSFFGWILLRTKPQFDLYDEAKILNEGDSYHSHSYKVNNQNIVGRNFTGTDTFFAIEGDQTIIMTIDISRSKGQVRVVWISPNNEIYDLKSGQNELHLMSGKHRFKVIGNQTDFELSYRIQ